MEQLPMIIPAAFILTTLLTLLLLNRASRLDKRLLLLVSGWLNVQVALTLGGFTC
jgi:hypothetical protein